MELQEKYREKYKGRKGRRRLQEMEDEILRLRRDTGNYYDDYEEMRLIEDRLPDPEARLYFMRCYHDLDAVWSGTLTYGFLRLCGKWIRQKEIDELTRPEIDRMLESLLPAREWQALTGAADQAQVRA